jgi:hypothetical protein
MYVGEVINEVEDLYGNMTGVQIGFRITCLVPEEKYTLKYVDLSHEYLVMLNGFFL